MGGSLVWRRFLLEWRSIQSLTRRSLTVLLKSSLLKVNLNSNKTVLQSIYLIFLFFYYVDPASPRARVSLLASHDHLRARRWYLAEVQAIKLRFFPVIQSTGNTDHSLFSSLPLYYVGSSEVPPRVFGPLGPKTLWGHNQQSKNQGSTVCHCDDT